MQTLRFPRLVAAAIVVLLAAIAAYWYFSPYVAMRTMRAAAQERDAETLNAHVDYPRLRESLKGQFAAHVAENMKGSEDNAFAMLGASIATRAIQGMVDIVVGPEVVMYALRTGKADSGAPAAAPANPPAPAASAPPADPSTASSGAPPAPPRWRMERLGTDRVVFHSQPAQDREGVALVFDRYGFASWKLTGMRLPPDAFQLVPPKR